jgi:Zn-dependent peptidase ImmA (M78 family)
MMARRSENALPRDRLRQLREWRRLPVTIAARAASVSAHELEALETGEKSASNTLIRRLSEAYAVPISRFYSENKEDLAPPIPDFRTIKNRRVEYTTHLVRSIAWADEISRFIKFLTSIKGATAVSQLPKIDKQSPATAAKELERILTFGANFRRSDLSTNQVIKHIKKELGDLGIAVLQDSINDETCRGFCFVDEDRAPTIVINTRNQGTYEARLFTLMHEVCHVLSGREGIVDPFSEADNFEQFCNSVTAEFLAPAQEFLSFASERLAGGTPGNSEVRRIARHFRLSQQATALRLEQLGAAQKGFYNSWLRQFEGIPFPDQARGGGASERPEEGVIKLAKFGHYFVLLCAEGIRNNQISEMDVFHVSRLKPQYFQQTVVAAKEFVAEVASYGQR